MKFTDTLKQLKELNGKRTQGEWEFTVATEYSLYPSVYSPDRSLEIVIETQEEMPGKSEDAKFIAQSASAMDKLIRAGELLEEATEFLRHDFRCSLPAEFFLNGKPACSTCGFLEKVHKLMGGE